MRSIDDFRQPFRLASALLGLIGLLNGSCARRATTVDQATQAGILHLSVGSEPTDLDPQTVTGLGDAKIIAALFEPIVTFDPVTLAPRPALAEHWEISPDGLTYIFHLRPTARWSNGDPITAEDCIASWRRILTPTLAAARVGVSIR
ncbi:MAG: ABC transporter substrate-binding protein, partial [Opitutaceae bacterium]